MRDADKMTAEELRDLADEKESNEQRTGTLKHDLYELNYAAFDDSYGVFSSDDIARGKIGKAPFFIRILKKGDKFHSRIDSYGDELWSSEYVNGADDMGSSWAKKNLIIDKPKKPEVKKKKPKNKKVG